MEKPKNSRITYPILNRYEKKYRKKVEKICPKCSGKMNEEIKYEFHGKVPHKKLIDKNGKVLYGVSRVGRSNNGFVTKYEQIPDAYTKRICYTCQSCEEEFLIGYLTENYFSNQGVSSDKMKPIINIWFLYGIVIILTLIMGISIGGIEQGFKPVLIVITYISISEAIKSRKRKNK